MKRLLKVFFPLMLLMFSFNGFSQNRIKGYVYDNTNQMPLMLAEVWVEGTTNGTFTDFNGHFLLTVNNSDRYVIVQAFGYIPELVPIPHVPNYFGEINMRIGLTPDNLEGVQRCDKRSNEGFDKGYGEDNKDNY